MAEILYQGHGSLRMTTDGGVVIYVDPFVGEGYEIPADIVLVTHQHADHNAVHLVVRKPGCRVIGNFDLLVDGEYKSTELLGVRIRAVPAYNRCHSREECVGYIVETDGKKVYFAGDTSKTDAMEGMAAEKLDAVFLPADGVYNMDAKGASECAALIGAKVSVPVHMKPGALFSERVARNFSGPGGTILHPGETLKI